MKKIVLILTILFSFNIYSQDSKPIKIDESYFTDNGNLKEDSDLKINVIRKMRFKDNSTYEMIILKNKYWYYYTLFQIEKNNQYKYIGSIPLNTSIFNIDGLTANVVYKNNYFTLEHHIMNNRKLYITFKYNDDKQIYLNKVSMLEISNTGNEITTNQYNGNITQDKILYKDVTKEIISKSLNIEL
ncbi:hypothetical protein [Brachyspira pulli]|uniref:hypothetical protein n=1 Tax=Brachyspira pulli TaxID=310721 RepID=UPI0030064300